MTRQGAFHRQGSPTYKKWMLVFGRGNPNSIDISQMEPDLFLFCTFISSFLSFEFQNE